MSKIESTYLEKAKASKIDFSAISSRNDKKRAALTKIQAAAKKRRSKQA